jgi:flagellar hook-basal body complex protein FliE
MAVNGISGFNSVSPSISKIGSFDTDKSAGVEGSFGSFLKDALEKVSDLEKESTSLTEDFAAGKTDNIHQVMIAAEKADVALQFTMQIRNKIMDAYNEIMRIQI